MNERHQCGRTSLEYMAFGCTELRVSRVPGCADVPEFDGVETLNVIQD